MTTMDRTELRARLLARTVETTFEAGDWQRAIAGEGNRRLLATIVTHTPRSVAELTDLVGRAQPNVSRSLVALVKAGLVELQQNGRLSAPVATELGQEKARALDLVAEPLEPQSATKLADDLNVSVDFEAEGSNPDRVMAGLTIRVCLANGRTIVGRRSGDVTSLAERWSRDWFRILCRRDAPYPLCDLDVEHAGRSSAVTVLIASWGSFVEMSARPHGRPASDGSLRGLRVSVEKLTHDIDGGILNPVARELNRRGEYDRPLHSSLAWLEEVRSDPADLAFHRTAGALNLSREDQTQTDMESLVRGLIAEIPEEETRLEFASSLLIEEVREASWWLKGALDKDGERNRLVGLPDIADSCRFAGNISDPKPHTKGVALAKEVRAKLRLAADRPVGGLRGLAALFGSNDFAVGAPAPGELLGFQACRNGAPTVVLAQSGEMPIFSLARGVGDYVAHGGVAAAISDIRSGRQALGRAFAAEFLAPSAVVTEMIAEGCDRQRVARHFGTTQKVIRHQYDNNTFSRGE